MRTDKTSELEDLLHEILQGSSLFLVDTEIKGNEKEPVLWIYLDSEEGGISLDQCAGVSRQLNERLESSGSFGTNFRLNVSSPGLSRPLKDIRQYKTNVGRTASVRYKAGEEVEKLKGVILSVEGENITFEVREGQTVTLAHFDIIETKILAII